jgi:broad specificity phosphatase PhoE
MRTLEHRRHSQRDPGSGELNAAGRALARRVGAGMGPFDRVVSSPKPRAEETARELGRPADALVAALAEMPGDSGLPVDDSHLTTFAAFAALLERSGAMAEYAHRQVEAWRAELERVPDGGSLLMISHAGVIEFGAAAALPTRVRTWGATLGYLEGVRLRWDGRRWASGEVLRVPQP